MSTLTTLRTALGAGGRARASLASNYTSRLATRQVHQSATLRIPYKDDMDRESVKPKSHENTQSGTDEGVAQKDIAFDRNKTDPETEKDAAAAQSNGNPLDESPASKGFAEAGRGSEEDKSHGGQGKASGGGSPPKKGKTA